MKACEFCEACSLGLKWESRVSGLWESRVWQFRVEEVQAWVQESEALKRRGGALKVEGRGMCMRSWACMTTVHCSPGVVTPII